MKIFKRINFDKIIYVVITEVVDGKVVERVLFMGMWVDTVVLGSVLFDWIVGSEGLVKFVLPSVSSFVGSSVGSDLVEASSGSLGSVIKRLVGVTSSTGTDGSVDFVIEYIEGLNSVWIYGSIFVVISTGTLFSVKILGSVLSIVAIIFSVGITGSGLEENELIPLIVGNFISIRCAVDLLNFFIIGRVGSFISVFMSLFSLISPGIEGSLIVENFKPKLFFSTDIIFLGSFLDLFSKSFEIL